MEIEGIVYKILPKEEVTFGDGTKRIKGGFVISCNMDYPHYVAFEMFGEERLSLLNGLTPGMPVRVGFYAESRLGKKGGYYTTLRCFNIMHLGAASNVPPVAGENPPTSNATPYSWNQTSNTEPTQNQKAKEVPHENDLSWDNDEVPF